MTRPLRLQPLSASGRRALQKALKQNWGGGLPLDALLQRINRLAHTILPSGPGSDSRVSREFSPRSFRHYQTLGCIDPPVRDGKRVLYASRHLVQALLVRRLLWAGISKDGIADIIANLTEEETHRALTDGMNFTAREGSRNENDQAPQQSTEAWTRTPLAPGIELHCRKGRGKLRPDELPKLLRRVERWLKGEVG